MIGRVSYEVGRACLCVWLALAGVWYGLGWLEVTRYVWAVLT